MMRTYLYYGPRDIRLENIAIPEIQNGEILVKVICAATGGTDLKTFQRGHPRIIKTIPSAFGYEFIGSIEKVSSSIGDFSVGDLVVAANTAPCEECFFCKKKEFSLCENLEFLNGSFAQYIKIPAAIVAKNLYKVTNLDKVEELCLTQTLAVALHGFKRSNIKDEDAVVVYGLGPIGQTFIKLIKAFTKAKVYALARSPLKLSLAKDNGADFVINIKDKSALEIEKDIRSLLPHGADVVIEAVGKPEAWQVCLGLVRKGGLINYFGGCPKDTYITVDTYRLHYDEIRLMGVFHHTPEYIREAISLITNEIVSMRNLISERLTLEQLEDALKLHEENKVFKTLIYPNV